MDDRVRSRLIDMRDFAYRAISLTGGLSADEFESDERTFYAVVKCVEVVGEAAAQIGRPALTDLDDAMPWADVIRMRNILVHEYAGISAATVFDTVTLSMPVLLSHIERLLES